MKIGILSDLHGNLSGLELALKQMGPVDDVYCLGDSIFDYRFSNDVVSRLREIGARVILGNHEASFFKAYAAGTIRQHDTDPALVAWLSEQPYRIECTAGGKKFLLVHASPWGTDWDYVYPHSPLLPRFSEIDADYVLMGHTHMQMAIRIGQPLVINPGSAGIPESHNRTQLSCAKLDLDADQVEFFSFPDPRLEETRAQILTRLATDRG